MPDIELSPQQRERLLRESQRVDGTMVPSVVSCLCSTTIDVVKHHRRWYSGRVNYDEILCLSCRKEVGSMPRVVCLKCKSLMGYVKPSKDKVTGFEMKMGHHYHIKDCPKCDPDVKATAIIEHDLFAAERGIRTKTNLDLLQEIEQKRLQGDVESDKLRTQLNENNFNENKTT